MFRSATFKLTLWYLGIVMAISLLFSVALFHVTTNELNRGIHRESQRIFRQYPVFQDDPELRPNRDFQTSSHRILLQLIGWNLLVLVGAGFSSYWLARRTLEPIEAAHEQQKRFTADVSHELRTPLTALRMETEVALMSGAKATELRQTLTSNLEEIAKLETLINNLLRLTRLEADSLQQAFTEVDLQAATAEAVAALQQKAAAHNISIASSVAPLKVAGDRESIVQLAVILLDNAIKYSPRGTTVRLSSETRTGYAILTISDEGKGIGQPALQHVFDRFYRAENSRNKDTHEGFGLGLSIAKLIADVHRGTITLQSRVGKGTNALVSLPLSAPAASSSTAVAAKNQK